MSLSILIYLIVYGSVTFTLIFVGFLLLVRKEKKSVNGSLDLNELVVIIPFRDEEKRMTGIISSIVNSKKVPLEIIFVNDHSSDQSVELLKRELSEKNIRILDLPTGRAGKKEALRYGIEQSSSTFILTMDADVSFSQDYFTHISQLNDADMHVLPAILKARRGIDYLFELDTILANALNVSIAGWKRPIFASGANLLYTRSSCQEVDNYDSHKHMSSGDDTYLLRDFRRNHKKVLVHSGATYAVSTETPHSLKAFFDQRVRWAGKSRDMNDTLANSLAIVQFLLSVSFISLLVFTLMNGNWQVATSLFLLKLGIDSLFFAPYFLRIGRLITIVFLPIYELIFPVYFVLLIGLIVFYSPQWKGRALKATSSN